MANWRRGFLRLWVLLTVLWAIVIGATLSSSITSPYIPQTLFTFNKDDDLEVVSQYGDAYSKMLSDESAGYYTRVGFNDDAPNMIYMAPNVIQLTIREKKFEAFLSNDRINNPDHEGLASSLLDFVANNDLNLAPPITMEEVRDAIPHDLPLKYKQPWVRQQVRDFAIVMQAELTDEARRRAAFSAISALAIPPIILLILGAAISWVITGFKRQRPAELGGAGRKN